MGLKSPEIITITEIALKWGSELNPDDRQNYDDILRICRNMKSIFEKLLTLSRSESHALRQKENPIDVVQSVNEVWERYADAVKEKHIEKNFWSKRIRNLSVMKPC